MPSKGFKDQEQAQDQKVALSADEQAAADLQAKTKYYWAPARMFQLGNFIQEKWSGGHRETREKPLRFNEHYFATYDKAEQDYIENSDGFKGGSIKLCASMQEVNIHTAALVATKTEKTQQSEHVSSVQIKDKGNALIQTDEQGNKTAITPEA